MAANANPREFRSSIQLAFYQNQSYAEQNHANKSLPTDHICINQTGKENTSKVFASRNSKEAVLSEASIALRTR